MWYGRSHLGRICQEKRSHDSQEPNDHRVQRRHLTETPCKDRSTVYRRAMVGAVDRSVSWSKESHNILKVILRRVCVELVQKSSIKLTVGRTLSRVGKSH